VRELAPDGVVVATGPVAARRLLERQPARRAAPGVDAENVLTGWDVLLGERPSATRRRPRRRRHAGVAGVCEVLLDRGSEVELVSRWNALFPTTLTTLDMAHLYSRLLGKGSTTG
jgi:hypothetical protein